MNKHVLTCLIALSLFGASCTGDLPLSDLVNNSVTLKVLGTYESNDPYSDLGLLKDDIITGTAITNSAGAWNNGSPQVATYTNSLAIGSVKYYIDLAEIRIAQGQGKSSSQTIADYWSQFAISRQLMCTDTSTAEAGRVLANCADQNGAQRLVDFFNGGFTYPATDVATGNYNHLGVYFRRFNTYPAARFNSSGSFMNASGSQVSQAESEQAATTIFDNRTIFGWDVESYLQNPYGSTATEPLMFPLQNKNLSISITNGAEPYVLEVRIFLKNLMMAHVIQATDGTGLAFVAPSDWNVDHKFNDASYSTNMGGSVLLTARTYQPSNVGKIQMAGAAGANQYFAAIPTSLTFDPTTSLPYAATRGSNTTITNLPPGSYNIYRTCDAKYCSNGSTAGACDGTLATNKDGFPETAVQCNPIATPVVVTAGTTSPGPITNCGSCP